jgi:hypothetical protein
MSSTNVASWKLIALGILGALVCVAVFAWGTPLPRDNQALVQSPEFAIWFAVNAVLFALYLIIGLLIFRSFLQYRTHFASHWREIAASSILLFCLFMLSLLILATAALRGFALAERPLSLNNGTLFSTA